MRFRPTRCLRNSEAVLTSGSLAICGRQFGSCHENRPIPSLEYSALQTRKHILLECTIHNEHRHILADDNGNTRLGDILATAKGIERLARFITATGAYNKPPEQ